MARQSGIGASEAAEALGLEPSPLELYLRKIGQGRPKAVSLPMRVGSQVEPLLLQLFTESTGLAIRSTQILARHDEHSYILATLDAIDSEGNPVETKWISHRRARELGDETLEQIPDAWNLQVHQQMLVSGTERANVAVMIGGEDFRVYPIERSDAVCRHLIDGIKEFWRRVEMRDPPPPMEEDDFQTISRVYAAMTPGIEADPGIEAKIAYAFMLGKATLAISKVRDRLKAEIADWMKDAKAVSSRSGWKAARNHVKKSAYVVEATEYHEMRFTAPKGDDRVTGAIERASESLIQGLESVIGEQRGEGPGGLPAPDVQAPRG